MKPTPHTNRYQSKVVLKNAVKSVNSATWPSQEKRLTAVTVRLQDPWFRQRRNDQRCMVTNSQNRVYEGNPLAVRAQVQLLFCAETRRRDPTARDVMLPSASLSDDHS